MTSGASENVNMEENIGKIEPDTDASWRNKIIHEHPNFLDRKNYMEQLLSYK